MASSFISGLSGLKAHQNWIDVIGNNLANSSTPGFKSSRATFADMVSRTLRPASLPSGTIGGINPVQIGLGVGLGSVDRDFNGGSLNATGRTFDLALEGKGFFAVNDGSQTLYTRVGTFGLDANNQMVDLRTGFQVLNAAGSAFTIDRGAVVPPSATGNVGFTGNLPATITGPLAEVMSSSSALAEGTPSTVTGTNATFPISVTPGDTLTMELIVNGGAPQTVTLTSATGSISTTDVTTAINQLDHVTATVASGGGIALTSDLVGSGSTIKVNPGVSGFDLANELGMPSGLVSGTQTAASLTTDLNDLTSNLSDYVDGDTIAMNATDADGTPIQASFTYDSTVPSTTVGDLVAFMNTQLSGSTASFNAATGQIGVTSDVTGEADLSMTLLDDSSSVGGSDWASHAFSVTTDGTGADTGTSSIEVFDAAGTAHLLAFNYTRQDDGSWNMDATVDAAEGVVNSGQIAGITFNPDGSIATPTTGTVSVTFTGQPAQNISVDLGTAGGFSGLTQFGGQNTLLADSQDGFGVGELSSIQVDANGGINGFYTNGELVNLGQFGVATFANENGLSDAGNNFWLENANTGTRVLSTGNLGAAGRVAGGAIEESNVDTAQEFVNMIQAQRGFQASARVISVQDEILNETVNLV
ncbi:MAG: flagellar hook protein FlgE [Planctomycetota bacterium]|jgi:flagellar hook protein FlgE